MASGYGAASDGADTVGRFEPAAGEDAAAGRGARRPTEAEQNHRERLFGAMVAKVAEKGYEATTVADLVELSGVSRSAFYKHFGDKQECFLAAIEALVWTRRWRRRPRRSLPMGEPPSDPDCDEGAFEELIEGIASQPAAATMCIVEVYAGGTEAVALLDRATDSLEDVAHAVLDGMGREGMPSEIVRALIGGVQKVIHKRLYQGKPEELADLAPQLWEWLFLYPPPPGRCGGRGGACCARCPSRSGRPPPTRRSGCCGRWRRWSPRRGIRRRRSPTSSSGPGPPTGRSTSASTARRTRSWRPWTSARCRCSRRRCRPSGGPRTGRTRCRGTQEAMFLYGVQEPEYARLGAVEMYAAGKRALEQREQVTEQMEALLAAGL